MQQTSDLRVLSTNRLLPPATLKRSVPMSERANRTVVEGRRGVHRILAQEDRRLLVVVGPCSIHDPKSALDYAQRLAAIRTQV